MIRLPKFELLSPETIHALLSALTSRNGDTMIMAGGTDLLANIKQGVASPSHVVWLGKVRELHNIVGEREGEIRIGSMCTLAEIASHPVILHSIPALVDAVLSIASPPIREKATLGGNLCLETRCVYFNQSEFWRDAINGCLKKPVNGQENDSLCHAAPGLTRCSAVFCSDTAPLLIAMGSSVNLISARGARTIPLHEFYREDGIRHLALEQGEVLAEIVVPPQHGRVSAHKKIRQREAIDYPLVNVGVSIVRNSENICTEASIVIGAIHSAPFVATEAEKIIIGNECVPEYIARAAEAAAESVSPLPNIGLTAGYRKKMVRALVQQALEETVKESTRTPRRISFVRKGKAVGKETSPTVTSTDGFARYSRFMHEPPKVVVEWKDDETDAVGWLVINSLRNGAAGGGTSMRPGATKEEAVFLAKTMEIKFGVAGPPIGGGKSVICFDSEDKRKHDVLRRWFQHIGPYLRHGYGTGGDLGVDEVRDVIPLLNSQLGLTHPQEGIIRGHLKLGEEGCRRIIDQLKTGMQLPVLLDGIPGKTFTVADLITGYGVMKTLESFCQLRGDSLEGKRILMEGFGVVGAPAAYYLHRAGANIVGIVTLTDRSNRGKGRRWIVDPRGLNVPDLMARRDGPHLPSDCPSGNAADVFWQTEADVFIPAGGSGTIRTDTIASLQNQGVTMIVAGANNPFAESALGEVNVQRLADETFSVIPDFIANCGKARAFSYLMRESGSIDAASLFLHVERAVQDTMKRLLDGYHSKTGILERAYSMFVP